MNTTNQRLCSEDEIQAFLGSMSKDQAKAREDINALLAKYPHDARLHFLSGSLLAGEQDYAGARSAMRQALDIAPGFDVARFQLGFLLLTCGEPVAAQETWGPLYGLAQDHYLRLFVTGLCHLIRDEFAEAIACLERGISQNRENAPMNRDMQLIVDEVRRKSADTGEQVSSVDLLLRQVAFKNTHH